jgi:uncharacterized cupin superfamily protein
MSWSLANVDEIPALGPAATREYWAQYTDDPAYVDGWRSVRAHLGVASFGVNVKDAAAGQVLVVPHREDDFGAQEELYFVFAGRARFTLDGVERELAAGDLLRVASGVDRSAVALETPTRVLMVGGVPGAAYTPE